MRQVENGKNGENRKNGSRRYLSFLSVLSVLSVSLCLSGCLAYPGPYWTTRKGQARLDNGQPVRVKAVLYKECANLDGETRTVVDERETMTDKNGRYFLRLRGSVWTWKSYRSGAECRGHVQMYICRPKCVPVDEIDINVLGK